MAAQSLIVHEACCHACGARCSARNAQAWAARHADHHGHVVEVKLGYRTDPAAVAADRLVSPRVPALAGEGAR
ncbi:MAG: hypothetical protein CML46_04930 [Rhodobacteraceae bacterium]|nr:hypothetical protein [Paracoccaceae bacterium]